MSSCAASCCICSPRASSASATSASSPTEGAPPYCRCASPLSTQLHRKPNRKPRPLQPCTRCGAVPSAANRWPLSNDSQPHNSNSVLHRSWPPLHELTRTLPHSLRFRVSRRSVSPFHPGIFFLSLPRSTSAINSSLHSAPPPSPPALTAPANFYTPPSPHSICIGPASAAPAASF
jgi:hypothetical protein